mgnify:CR=1 FL=1
MERYTKDYHIIKQKIWRYRQDDKAKQRGMFLNRVLYDLQCGSSIQKACENRGRNRKYFYYWLHRLKKHKYELNL